MARYKFHIFNDDQTIDGEGKEFPTLEAARSYAVDCARDIMAHELRKKGEIDLSDWIEIEDEFGEMHVVTFGDAAKILGSCKD